MPPSQPRRPGPKCFKLLPYILGGSAKTAIVNAGAPASVQQCNRWASSEFALHSVFRVVVVEIHYEEASSRKRVGI